MFNSSCKWRWFQNPPGIFLAAAVFLFPALLSAQDASREGRVFHILGPDFSISSEGRRNVYTREDLGESRGLSKGDLLQTGAATWAEFQILPDGTVIKAAENTSVIYNGYDEQGRFFDIGLLYGRVRVVSGGGTLVIRSGPAAVRISEGDLGLDYVVEPLAQGRSGTPKPRLRLYAFRGGAGVTPFDPSLGVPGGTLSGLPIMVYGGESLSLEVQAPLILAERSALGEGIFHYWTGHNFEGRSPGAMPETALALPADEAPVPEPEKNGENSARIAAAAEAEKSPPFSLSAEAVYTRTRRVKNITMGVGLALVAAGAAVQGFSHYYGGGGDFVRNLYTVGYGSLGMGLVTLLAGMLYNPAPR